MQPDEGSSPRRSIHRTELVLRLRRRFEPGATILVAGAGFGKSVTLQQAVAANALAPAGVDRLLTCTPPLRVASRFAAAVAECLGHEPRERSGPAELVAAALEHAARRWPLGVALLLDDVHLLEGSDAEPLLRHLWTQRPPPVHLVLTSRTPLPWATGTRAGDDGPHAGAIGEDDLRFDEDEVRALIEGTAIGAEAVAPLAGWPALTDLAAAFGIAGASGFVEDEVLSRFRSDERRQLAALAAIGGGDPDLVEAACGRNLDPVLLASQLPMTSLDGDHLQIHPLWAEILEGTLDEDEVRAVRARVAQRLLDRGEPEAAATRFAEAGAWAGFERAVGATWRGGYLGGARDVVAHWLALLPVERRDSPTGLVLRGVAARVNDSFGERARDLLELAVERCRAAGDVPTEMVALGEYGYVCRARGELDRLLPVMERLGALADVGVREAEPFVALAEAAICDVVGDDEGVLDALGRVGPGTLSDEWASAAAFLRLTALGSLGGAAEVEAAAADCRRYAGAQAPLARYATAAVAWHLGRPEEALAQLPSLPDDPGLTRVEQVVAATRCAVIEALAGRTDVAADCLDIARSAAPTHAHPSFEAQLAVAHALLAVGRRDDESARGHLRALLADHPLDRGGGAVAPLGAGHRLRLAARGSIQPGCRTDRSRAPGPPRGRPRRGRHVRSRPPRAAAASAAGSRALHRAPPDGRAAGCVVAREGPGGRRRPRWADRGRPRRTRAQRAPLRSGRRGARAGPCGARAGFAGDPAAHGSAGAATAGSRRAPT